MPESTALRVHLGDAPPQGAGLAPGLWSGLDWRAKLAVRLLFEASRGAASPFAGYLRSLPAAVDVPATWPEADLQQLQYPYIIHQVKAEDGSARRQKTHAGVVTGLHILAMPRDLCMGMRCGKAPPCFPVGSDNLAFHMNARLLMLWTDVKK